MEEAVCLSVRLSILVLGPAVQLADPVLWAKAEHSGQRVFSRLFRPFHVCVWIVCVPFPLPTRDPPGHTDSVWTEFGIWVCWRMLEIPELEGLGEGRPVQRWAAHCVGGAV